MIIIMKPGASPENIDRVARAIEAAGCRPDVSRGEETTVVGVIGDGGRIEAARFSTLDGVDRVVPVLRPFRLAGRESCPEGTIVSVGNTTVGGDRFTVAAGPCAVESSEQILTTARRVRKAGAAILRGGAFKPRTSPYSFQGLGREGLLLLAEARRETGLPVVTEVMTPEDVPLVAEHADLLQIGARNMQNFPLLDACGRQPKPVLLKRGMMATLEELLLAAEHLLSRGNRGVILCERGIRTFEKYTRNTLDLSAVPVLRKLSHLPVIVDPSHAAGERDYVAPLARAALAAGAHGLLLEVHPDPRQALCDGQESLTPDEFDRLMDTLRPIAAAMNVRMA